MCTSLEDTCNIICDRDEDNISLTAASLIPILIKAIKELSAEVDALKAHTGLM